HQQHGNHSTGAHRAIIVSGRRAFGAPRLSLRMIRRLRSIALALAPLATFAACGGSVNVSNETETVTGTERFGWDQPAADAGELSSFRYAMYVDDARTEAADVECANAATGG